MTNASEPERPRLSLALSGGGFRASLFHLGVLRRAAEAGWLSALDVVSSVSGGSVLAAFLAPRWQEFLAAGGTPQALEDTIAGPFRQTIRHRDLLREWLVQLPRGLARKLQQPSFTRTALIAELYQEMFLRPGLTCADLPGRPTFILNASSLVSGRAFRFTREGLGDSRLGYALWRDHPLPLGDAVAASAAFPPAFPPYRVRRSDYAFGAPVYGERALPAAPWIPMTDGGVYDNLGIEALLKTTPLPGLARGLLPAQFLLVSDAGFPAQHRFRSNGLPVWSEALLFYRVSNMALDQVSGLRRRILIRQFEESAGPAADSGKGGSGSLVALGSSLDALDRLRPALKSAYLERIGPEHAIPDALVDSLHRVRTSLDIFSATEAEALAYLGYQLADAALWAHDATHPAQFHVGLAPPEWTISFTPEVVRRWTEDLEFSGRIRLSSGDE